MGVSSILVAFLMLTVFGGLFIAPAIVIPIVITSSINRNRNG